MLMHIVHLRTHLTKVGSMGVPFDDAAADGLISAARDADGVLSAQGVVRRSAAEAAMSEFRGSYAELYEQACATEAVDRMRLARTFDDLASQVEHAKQQARAEEARLASVAAWDARDAERDERRQEDPVGGGITSTVEELFDPRPSDPPVRPPTVAAAFSASQRVRTSSGAGGSTSSAVPDDLRGAVATARSCDTALRQQVELVSSAWLRFTASCSWVPIGTSSFLSGAADLADENDSDASWIDHVAGAFEAAGSGTLTNRALDLSVVPFLSFPGDDPVSVLSHMDPEVAEAWLAAHPAVLQALVTTPPAWGTPSSVLTAIVGAVRATGADPATYSEVLQQMYVTRAAEKTGIDLAGWDTSKGAEALMGQVGGSYEYYAQLYLENPDFTWAGMANLVGPDFAAGFLDLHSFRDHIGVIAPLVPPEYRPATDVLAGMSDDEIAFYETTFLDMQKDIFFDASTMHEAYLADGMAGIEELRAAGLLAPEGYDQRDSQLAENTVVRAWQDIDAGIASGDDALLDRGNAALLYREQHDTIQPSGYDAMLDHGPTGPAFTQMLGIVGDASIPGAKTLGQYEGGVSVPVDYVPLVPGVQGQTETWYVPTGNIADFEVRWDYIANDTLPAWQDLVHDDPDRARALVGASVPERIEDRRLDARWPELVDDLHDTEFTWE